jgi:sugar phosphate isomerase/epimerase
MLCYSPDFTVPNPVERREQVRQAERMIDLVAFFGGKTCRVLSGQRRPGVGREQGVEWVVEGITALLPHAERRGIVLALENHYKDDFWTYPEFAQQKEVFLEILGRIPSPWLGVNYDPSNAILAGDDPLELLEAVKERVVSMHASDRHLKPGHTLEELRKVENVAGYASILQHGVIGQGMNDYDAIFRTLHTAGFDGWISIEDGMNGLDEIAQSAAFLREKIARYWVPEHV